VPIVEEAVRHDCRLAIRACPSTPPINIFNASHVCIGNGTLCGRPFLVIGLFHTPASVSIWLHSILIASPTLQPVVSSTVNTTRN
jgi:hypothetical protein